MRYEIDDSADAPDFDALPRVIGRDEALRRMSRHAVDRRLASGRWRRVAPRTYLTADTFTHLDRLDAAVKFAGAGARLSGAAALFASEVPGVPMPGQVLVLVPAGRRLESWRWIQVRASSRPSAAQRWYGPPRVEVARAAADLAVTMPRLDDVRALVSRVVQRKLCTPAELAAELEAGPRRGSAHLRQALREVGVGAESAPEARAAAILRRAGVRDFVQNQVLRLPDGTTRRVDFYWPALRACLEIDSYEFHFERADWQATMDRHLALTTFGYSVIHRPPSALGDPARFVREVRAWLAGRAAELAGRSG